MIIGKSAVAGVLSLDGGLRAVVDHPRLLHTHLVDGERLFVVPDLWVDEPVPWEEIPALSKI